MGKTWTTVRLALLLRAAGHRVCARKPVESFDPQDAFADSDALAAATGEDPSSVCPPHRRFALALAPPMAAEALASAPFSVNDLVREQRLPDAGIALVEGVGGPLSPLAGDGNTVTLAEAMGADAVVVVADGGLGTINATLLCLRAFAGHRVIVHLNRFDETVDLHARNVAWLREREDTHVVTDIDSLAAALLQSVRPVATAARRAVAR